MRKIPRVWRISVKTFVPATLLASRSVNDSTKARTSVLLAVTSPFSLGTFGTRLTIGLSIINDTPREWSTRFRSGGSNDWYGRPSTDRDLRNEKPFTRQKVTDNAKRDSRVRRARITRAENARRCNTDWAEPSRTEDPSFSSRWSSTVVEVASAGRTKWWRLQERTLRATMFSALKTIALGAIDSVIILPRLNLAKITLTEI